MFGQIVGTWFTSCLQESVTSQTDASSDLQTVQINKNYISVPLVVTLSIKANVNGANFALCEVDSQGGETELLNFFIPTHKDEQKIIKVVRLKNNNTLRLKCSNEEGEEQQKSSILSVRTFVNQIKDVQGVYQVGIQAKSGTPIIINDTVFEMPQNEQIEFGHPNMVVTSIGLALDNLTPSSADDPSAPRFIIDYRTKEVKG